MEIIQAVNDFSAAVSVNAALVVLSWYSVLPAVAFCWVLRVVYKRSKTRRT